MRRREEVEEGRTGVSDCGCQVCVCVTCFNPSSISLYGKPGYGYGRHRTKREGGREGRRKA